MLIRDQILINVGAYGP